MNFEKLKMRHATTMTKLKSSTLLIKQNRNVHLIQTAKQLGIVDAVTLRKLKHLILDVALAQNLASTSKIVFSRKFSKVRISQLFS